MLVLGHAAEAQQAPAKPNILFVLTDDQMPSTLEHMPNYQRLAEQGRVFENTVNVHPWCCPARAVMQRGQYSHNTGVTSNTWPQGGYRRFEANGLADDSLPVWLQTAGYETAYFGKYMNGYAQVKAPPGWDRWFAYAGSHGMGWSPISDGTKYLETKGANDSEARVAKRAANYIESAEGPYFATVAFGAPHEPYPYPKAYADRFGGVKSPRTAAFNERDVSDKPRYVRSRDRMGGKAVRATDEKYREALRSLVRVDSFIGEALREQNTYVVFTTDNGTHTGYHRLPYGKRTPYEVDMVFPMTIRGPGVEPGTTQKLVGNHDLAPTLVDLAGGAVPEFVDGRSVVPLFGGDVEPWRTAILSRNVASAEDKAGDAPAWTAVRTESRTYVEYGTGERELYDILSDPDNSENLLAPGGSGDAEELPVRLETLKGCSAEKAVSCPEAEGP
jgi:N-acetylglucosamine-6-sulfatase